jgi:hypothetical protein
VDDPDDGTYSRPPNLEDVARIGRALNEAQARYVLIGGFAVIIHGSGRTTKDIDFLVDPSPENVAPQSVRPIASHPSRSERTSGAGGAVGLPAPNSAKRGRADGRERSCDARPASSFSARR